MEKSGEFFDKTFIDNLIQLNNNIQKKYPEESIIFKTFKPMNKNNPEFQLKTLANLDIHYAARDSNLTLLKKCLENYPIDIRGSDGLTPLHWAVKNGSLEIVEFLIENGANIEAQTFLKTTPLTLVCDFEKNDRIPIIKYLVNKGANVNHNELDGSTALHWAAEQFNLDIIKFLIENKADIYARDNEGNSPADRAFNLFADNVVYLFLNYGKTILSLNDYSFVEKDEGNYHFIEKIFSKNPYPDYDLMKKIMNICPNLREKYSKKIHKFCKGSYENIQNEKYMNKIGKKINDFGGFELMQIVFHILRIFSPIPKAEDFEIQYELMKKVEIFWDGIGKWKY